MNERVTVIEEDKAGGSGLARRIPTRTRVLEDYHNLDGLLKVLHSRASTSRGCLMRRKNCQNNQFGQFHMSAIVF
jgi:hypothetical protein